MSSPRTVSASSWSFRRRHQLEGQGAAHAAALRVRPDGRCLRFVHAFGERCGIGFKLASSLCVDVEQDPIELLSDVCASDQTAQSASSSSLFSALRRSASTVRSTVKVDEADIYGRTPLAYAAMVSVAQSRLNPNFASRRSLARKSVPST